MLVDESLDHIQVTTWTLKGEGSVSSLIHCNCGYKQIVDTIESLQFRIWFSTALDWFMEFDAKACMH